MLRETLFWEVELVRLEDGAPVAPARRLDFSVRPLTALLGALLLAETALVGYIYTAPPENEMPYRLGTYCGCGGPYDPEAVIRTPPRPTPDSTFLVRRLP